MQRRAFLSAALLPAAASPALSAPVHAPVLAPYHPEVFGDYLDSGAMVALVVAREGCTNHQALNGVRALLGAHQERGDVAVMEWAWEQAAPVLGPEGIGAPALDQVGVVVYQDGGMRGYVLADTSLDRVRRVVAPVA